MIHDTDSHEEGKRSNENNELIEIYYATGYIRAWIENFARSCTLSPESISSGVAELLRAQGSWSGKSLSTLQRKASNGDKRVEQMALDRGTSSNKTSTLKKKRKPNSFWASLNAKQRTELAKKRWRKRIQNLKLVA